MTTIHFTVGLPGSGKTTWAKQFVKDRAASQQPETIVRVNRDDLRQMLHDSEYSPDNEKIVRQVQEAIIYDSLAQCRSVLVDDTNLNPATRKNLADIARDFAQTAPFQVRPVINLVEWNQFLQVPVSQCILQDSQRKQTVGQQVILDMAEKWKDQL